MNWELHKYSSHFVLVSKRERMCTCCVRYDVFVISLAELRTPYSCFLFAIVSNFLFLSCLRTVPESLCVRLWENVGFTVFSSRCPTSAFVVFSVSWQTPQYLVLNLWNSSFQWKPKCTWWYHEDLARSWWSSIIFNAHRIVYWLFIEPVQRMYAYRNRSASRRFKSTSYSHV